MRLCNRDCTKTRLNSHIIQQLIVIINYLTSQAFGTIVLLRLVFAVFEESRPRPGEIIKGLIEPHSHNNHE